jgi:hypothetical protein
LLGDGNNKFHNGKGFGSFPGAPQIIAADINGDGKLDLITSQAGHSVSVFLGNGDGTFQNFVDYEGVDGYLQAGDFNGDGKLDLIVEAEFPGLHNRWNLFFLAGNGDGTFQKPKLLQSISIGCAFGQNLWISDFNNDGKLDLAFCGESQIGIMLGNGDGTFQQPLFHTAFTTRGGFTFTVGDFNSDGKTDLIIQHDGVPDNQFVTLLGNGDGTFQPVQFINGLACTGEAGMVSGDFNRDGLLDLAQQTALAGVCVSLQQ